jgi:hypothetical protein
MTVNVPEVCRSRTARTWAEWVRRARWSYAADFKLPRRCPRLRLILWSMRQRGWHRRAARAAIYALKSTDDSEKSDAQVPNRGLAAAT